MVGNFSVNVPNLFGVEASKYMLCVKVAKCHWGNKSDYFDSFFRQKE